MKIAIFNWRDIKNPASGGAEIATHEIAKRLVLKGHKVILYASGFKNSKKIEVVDGVKIHRSGNPFTVYLKAPFFYFKHLKNKVDVAIDQIHGLPFFTPLYVKEPKVAYIHEVAGKIWFFEWQFPVNILGYILEKLYFRLYSKITFVTVSESTKKDLITHGIEKNKIKIITNGFSPPYFQLSKVNKEKTPTIIYLGRIYRSKRIEDILKVTKIVQKKSPNFKLWIVGKGKVKFENYIKKLITKLDLNENTTFYGFVSEKKKYQLLKKAWIICSTSIKEGWGLNIIEAGFCQTPAVVYNVGGLVDVVKNNQTGLICGKNSPENLAKNILKLVSSRNLRRKLAINAATFAKTLNWGKTTKDFLQVLDQVAKAS